METVVQNSFLYRWLTKEPDPEVVVIDLRETYTIGPFIELLDRLVETTYPYWQTSTLRRGVDRLATLSERALETRPGQLLLAAFEPPEPPESNSDESDR
ncbi:hypothetical protein [Halospeciosus flavus]|uniref:hypothetical protein n=1 Tax=Halospeciosus flavus TaxID=3032283 RepID=UPI0036063A33